MTDAPRRFVDWHEWSRHVWAFVSNEIPRVARKYGVTEAEVMRRVPPDRCAELLILTYHGRVWMEDER